MRVDATIKTLQNFSSLASSGKLPRISHGDVPEGTGLGLVKGIGEWTGDDDLLDAVFEVEQYYKTSMSCPVVPNKIDDVVDYSRNTKVFSKDPIEWSATRPKGTQLDYKVYQRNDVESDLVRTTGDKRFIGKTNAETAAKGLPPELPDGNFVTLHHLGQKPPRPLVETSTKYHGVGKSGQDILHSQYGRSKPHPTLQPGRNKFNVDTRDYWKWRVNDQGG